MFTVSLKEAKEPRTSKFADPGFTEKKMNKSTKGFSLLELLIVVAIILIIATIAIPSLLRSRQAAHEAAAVATLRTINTAQITYLSTANGKFGNLVDLVNNQLIGPHFIPGPVSGYFFSITLDSTGSDFTVTAEPASANDGRYGYFITPDGTIRYSMVTSLAPAGAAGTPVTQ
jgi:prepilin-type N-terminal cleavage/methylation domain-containing protein